MSDKFQINLKIAGGKPLAMKIERAEEETYRRAEREVNALVENYRGKFRGEREDYLAMTALKLSVNNVGIAMSQTVNDDSEIDILKEIESKLDRYLDTI